MQTNENRTLQPDSGHRLLHGEPLSPIPVRASGIFAYIESRGVAYDRTLFFGLQYILTRYLATHFIHAMVDDAKDLFTAHRESVHG